MKKLFFWSVVISLLGAVFFLSFMNPTQAKSPQKESDEFYYVAKDYTHLLGTSGLSDGLLNDHFKLYEGYVKNTNIILDKLNLLLSEGREKGVEYAELKRRLGWEFDGMRLHEYYFENIGRKAQLDDLNPFYNKVLEDFGNFDSWKKDFIATGSMRGIGWVVLYQDTETGRLINTWINEHDTGHLAGGKVLLVMDVFEHAYITDYGLDRVKYIETFFENINWPEVSKRFEKK